MKRAEARLARLERDTFMSYAQVEGQGWEDVAGIMKALYAEIDAHPEHVRLRQAAETVGDDDWGVLEVYAMPTCAYRLALSELAGRILAWFIRQAGEGAGQHLARRLHEGGWR